MKRIEITSLRATSVTKQKTKIAYSGRMCACPDEVTVTVAVNLTRATRHPRRPHPPPHSDAYKKMITSKQRKPLSNVDVTRLPDFQKKNKQRRSIFPSWSPSHHRHCRKTRKSSYSDEEEGETCRMRRWCWIMAAATPTSRSSRRSPTEPRFWCFLIFFFFASSFDCRFFLFGVTVFFLAGVLLV